MSHSLQAKYVQALEYSRNALELQRKITQQRIRHMAAAGNPFKIPYGPYYYMWKEFKLMWNPNFYLGRITAEMRETFYASASEEQKNNSIFIALTSDSPMESLAICMKEDLNLKIGDAVKLSKIHELTKKHLTLSNPLIMVPFLSGILAVLSKLIPKEFFDSICADCYAQYQIGIFILIMVIMVPYLVIAIPFWFRYLSAKNQHEFCETLLAYRVVLDEDEKDTSQAKG